VAGAAYAVLDWLTVGGVLLSLEGDAQERLQALVQRLPAGCGAVSASARSRERCAGRCLVAEKAIG